MMDIVKGGGRAHPPSPHPPSLWNVRKKVAIATLCVGTLWSNLFLSSCTMQFLANVLILYLQYISITKICLGFSSGMSIMYIDSTITKGVVCKNRYEALQIQIQYLRSIRMQFLYEVSARNQTYILNFNLF